MIWMFPKIGVPENGWFMIMETPIKMDDLGVPLFLEIPIYSQKTTTYRFPPNNAWFPSSLKRPYKISYFLGGCQISVS